MKIKRMDVAGRTEVRFNAADGRETADALDTFALALIGSADEHKGEGFDGERRARVAVQRAELASLVRLQVRAALASDLTVRLGRDDLALMADAFDAFAQSALTDAESAATDTLATSRLNRAIRAEKFSALFGSAFKVASDQVQREDATLPTFAPRRKDVTGQGGSLRSIPRASSRQIGVKGRVTGIAK